MPVTAQQKLTNAYNEFIREFSERHGECQATWREAYDRADELKEMGLDMGALIVKHKLRHTDADFMITSQTLIERDEREIVACAVAVALEEVK